MTQGPPGGKLLSMLPYPTDNSHTSLQESPVQSLYNVPAGPDVADYALALLDLGSGRWNDALDRLEGMGDPALAIVTLPDRIEAAVRAGRHDAAQTALETLEACVSRSRALCSPARLAACRALVAAGEDAAAHFEDALTLDTGARPFDRARIQLLYGEHLRRSRRRAEARTQLRAALTAFEELRADPWAERVRTELRASGETARKRDSSTLAELTPQEVQVAGFVAQGLSNKEVASRLFLSPRTIDAHLRNVFAKLQVTSRTQLARHLLAGDGLGDAVLTPSLA
jgi:DNA-binding CsgD family transcriptional regulator